MRTRRRGMQIVQSEMQQPSARCSIAQAAELVRHIVDELQKETKSKERVMKDLEETIGNRTGKTTRGLHRKSLKPGTLAFVFSLLLR